MTAVELGVEILRVRARLAGLQCEQAVHAGDRAGAEAFKVQMYDLIAQRMDAAEQAGECFFTTAGEVNHA